MKKETDIERRIMIALSQAGCVVFKNEVGAGYVGRVTYRDGQTVTIGAATYMKFGLHKGSSDIIGWTGDGRFLAVEVKTAQGRATKEQVNFIDAVLSKGGVGFFARSPEEAVSKLLEF